MSFFENIRKSIGSGFERRRINNQRMDEIRKEAEMERRKIFEEKFKEHALKIARVKAYKDAARLSGMQKLTAENRLRRLNQSSSEPPPGSFFEKFRDYTSKNIARREENFKNTEELRKNAEKIRQERINNKFPIAQRPVGFGKPKWKM